MDNFKLDIKPEGLRSSFYRKVKDLSLSNYKEII